jgi:hypothetical protein
MAATEHAGLSVRVCAVCDRRVSPEAVDGAFLCTLRTDGLHRDGYLCGACRERTERARSHEAQEAQEAQEAVMDGTA